MKLIKILVWVLLFMILYDLATYFLFAGDKTELPKKIGNEEKISILNHIGSKLDLITYWSIGVVILISLISFRDVYFKFLPKSCLAMDKLLEPSKATEIKKNESFLTCRVSNTTIHSFWEDKDYDISGPLTAPQLQVLLEELKFTTDEKLEVMENWIENSEEQSKLWGKRLERLETELSYIRHQIFILMSNHTTVNPRLSIAEVPDTRNQMETLRDLTSILAQVKQQFNEDESKGMKLTSLVKEKDNQNSLDDNILERKNTGKITELVEKESKVLNCQMQEVHTEEEENGDKFMAGDNKISNPSDSDSDSSSEKSVFKTSDELMPDQIVISDKVLKPFRPVASRSLSPVLTLKTNTHCEKPVTPKKSSSFHLKPSETITPDLMAVDLTKVGLTTVDTTTVEPTDVKPEAPLVKKSNDNVGQSPKRTVRFVDEKFIIVKDSSPKREPSPSKPKASRHEARGAVINSYIKCLRDSVNMEIEEGRMSRRSVTMDNKPLKRGSSPSPTRSNKNKLNNVKSKVADYIKGSKY